MPKEEEDDGEFTGGCNKYLYNFDLDGPHRARHIVIAAIDRILAEMIAGFGAF